MTAYHLSFSDVGLSLVLMALAIALSRFQKLGTERSLAVGTVRSFVQLTLVGYALKVLFDINTPWVMGGVLAVMLTVASFESTRRQQVRVPGFFGVTFMSLLLALIISMGTMIFLIVRPRPWFSLMVTIPIAGMMIGNGLNIVSLAANRLLGELRLRRNEVEVALSLAAPPSQALHTAFKQSISSSLIPAINALMAVGLVQLPGVMTGQILAGAPPVEAVKFQIVIMMMWVSNGLICGVVATRLLMWRLVSPRWQVRWEMIGGD